jgi:DNA-binding response OmpR family regulator
VQVPAPQPEWLLVPERSSVRVGRREVALSPTEFRLLTLLMGEPGRTFTRAELVERVLGGAAEERTVDAHIKELPRKLGPHGLRVKTVRGAGYRNPAQQPAV